MEVLFDRVRAWSEDSATVNGFHDPLALATNARYAGRISWPDERARELRRKSQQSFSENVRDQAGEWAVIVGGAVLTAILARGAGALGDLLDTLRSGHCSGVWYATRRECCASDACADWKEWPLGGLMFVLLSALFAAGSALLVDELAARTAMSGVSELKAYFSGYRMVGLLGVRQLFVKSAGMALALGSGLYVGREGPLVHIACAAGAALITLVFRDPRWAKFAAERQAARALSRTPSASGSLHQISASETLSAGGTFNSPRQSDHQNEAVAVNPGFVQATIAEEGVQPAAKKHESITESRKRDLLIAVAAAGVALSFNAPIGGVLFIVEILGPKNKRVLWRGFVAAITSVLAFEILSDKNAQILLQYEVSYDRVWHGIELILFGVLGSLCGLAGALMVKANVWIMQRRREAAKDRTQAKGLFARALALSPIATAAATAAITAVFAWPDILSMRTHSDLLSDLLQECRNQAATGFLCNGQKPVVIAALVYCLAQVTILLPVTYGLAIPAGILQPALLFGALLGRIFGLGASSLFASHPSFLSRAFCPDGTSGDCVTPGVYALVGAAAALTGVTRLTVAAVVILVEMTDALTYVVPIMVGVMASKWMGDAISPLGIYDAWLKLENLVIPSDRLTKPLPHMVAGDIMKAAPQCAVAKVSDSVAQLALLVQTHDVFAFPVVSAHGNVLLGSINVQHLRETLPTDLDAPYDITEHLTEDLSVMNTRTPLSTLYFYAMKRGFHTCFLTDCGKFMGIITFSDICDFVEQRRVSAAPARWSDVQRPSLDRGISDL